MKIKETKNKKPMLGEVLFQNNIITLTMLKDALSRQSQSGNKIGAVLIEMGCLDIDTLLNFLSSQFAVPAVNLSKVDIPQEILKLLPIGKIKKYKVLPVEVNNKLSLAMVNPNDYVAISDVEFILGKSVQPMVAASLQMQEAIKRIEAEGLHEFKGEDLKSDYRGDIQVESDELEQDFRSLLQKVYETKSHDLQLTAGVPPALKSTDLRRLNMRPLTPAQMMNYATILMTDEQQAAFRNNNDLDFAFTDSQFGRFRVNIYRQRGSVSITLRRIPDIMPKLHELGISQEFESFALKPQGFILITGPTGHGKSTTMAALVDIINLKRNCNIITLEDPIEFLHRHKNSNVNQREIGIDTASFHDGLRHIFRQAPDVIIIGEMRDRESFEIALQAAETGHLVISTLHSRNTTSTIERIIDIFPSEQQAQIRTQVADSLLLILSQRLVMKKDHSGLVLAYEKLINSYKIKNFIREGKTHQIRTQMQTANEEYSSIDMSLSRLYHDGIIAREEGAKHADNISHYLEITKENSHK